MSRMTDEPRVQSPRRILDGEQMIALVRDLASRVHPLVVDGGRLVGIDERGVALAELIVAELPESLRALPARLDPGVLNPASLQRTSARWSPDASILRGESVVLVDTALKTGRRVMRAARHLASAGVGRIDVAVLCHVRDPDPGGTVQCVSSIELTAPPGGIIRVNVPPVDPELDVWVMPEMQIGENDPVR